MSDKKLRNDAVRRRRHKQIHGGGLPKKEVSKTGSFVADAIERKM